MCFLLPALKGGHEQESSHSCEGPVDCVPEIWGVMTWLSSAYVTVTHAWCAFSLMRRIYNGGDRPPMAESSHLFGGAEQPGEQNILYSTVETLGKNGKQYVSPKAALLTEEIACDGPCMDTAM